MGGFDENKADLKQLAFEFTKTVKVFMGCSGGFGP